MELEEFEPLDFEKEDKILKTPGAVNKRRKLINLDDLLDDHYAERNKPLECKSKNSSLMKNYNSDEEDNRTKELCALVDNCQKQFNEMHAEEEVQLWGQRIFGHQKARPSINYEDLSRCQLLKSLSSHELISIINLNIDEDGESFLEGLLTNRWLSKLAFVSGQVEDSLALWTFNILLYSSNVNLQFSACEFWCDILLSKNEDGQPRVLISWFPSYSEFKGALDIYGYISDSSDSSLSHSQTLFTDSGLDGPPENIISWIQVVSACCQIRSIHALFSSCEAEELLSLIIQLFLDRQFQGLLLLLNECLSSITSYFSDEEWKVSCKKVAESIACRIPKNLNCLRVVECINVVNQRSSQLRSEVALQVQIVCFEKKVTTCKEILENLMTVNVKDKDCDFLKLYIYLVLAENFLCSICPVEEKSVVLDMWYKLLRNCSSQITSTDWRSNASKVRNKASYLLQRTVGGSNS